MTKSPDSSAPNGTESVSAIEELSTADQTLTSATTEDIPEFGWSAYAERLNGRFAMIGLLAVLLIEAISGNTFLHWAGLLN